MDKIELILDAAKLLLKIAKDLKLLAGDIEAVCTTVSDGLSKDIQPELPVAEEKKTSVTLEQVRSVLAEKSRDGYTAEVKELIAKYGASRLSDIDPKDFEAVLKEAEVLDHAG